MTRALVLGRARIAPKSRVAVAAMQTPAEKVLAATRAWHAECRDALMLKAARNASQCEHWHSTEYEVCWRRQTDEGDFLPVAERCQPCQVSRALHLEYVGAVARAGGRLRALRRLLDRYKEVS